jgi:hypothetical protein
VGAIKVPLIMAKLYEALRAANVPDDAAREAG